MKVYVITSGEYSSYQICAVTLDKEQEHILDQLKAEIDWERKWLAQAGYNAYNVNIAFSSINNILRK